MSNQPEMKLQQECYLHFHNNYPDLRGCLWRVENERKRNKYEQMIAKSTGLVSGVADLNMIYAGRFYGIELKVGDNKQSKSQIQWQKTIQKQGGSYIVIRNLEEFQAFLHRILSTYSKTPTK